MSIPSLTITDTTPPFYIFDDFLRPEDFRQFMEIIQASPETQDNVEIPDVALTFWETYKEHFLPLGFTGIMSTITISKNRKALIRHTDQQKGAETHKALIYLNEVPSGGTIFFLSSGQEFVTEPKENRMVLFDIRVPHMGQRFARRQTKYTIGFRLLGGGDRGPARN